MNDHWTAEEYREWQRTGKEPKGKEISREELRSIVDAIQHPIHQEEIERRYAEAEKRGEVMTLYIDCEPEKPKRAKYGNRKAERGWKKFDSEHEAKTYDDLMLRVKAGELKCVLRQVPFDLLEKSRLQYFADFVTIRPDNTIEGVYDAKSEATRKDKTYVVKKKLMKELWDIEIIEI